MSFQGKGLDMINKTAVLVVSFGTSHMDTLGKTIAAIERQIEEEFPQYTVRRAFTSGIIMGVWQKRGVDIKSTDRALEILLSEGYETVIVQPTHIINGNEYEKMLSQLAPFMECMKILVGKPLLTEFWDFKLVAEAIIRQVNDLGEDEGLVLMGHGSEHFSNAAYAQMEYILRDMGLKRAFVGTVEGYPGLDEVLRALKGFEGIKRLRLLPFMIVAGDHAKNDMAGDGPGSWRAVFESLGYETACILKGLGEDEAIRAIFADHVRNAGKILVPSIGGEVR